MPIAERKVDYISWADVHDMVRFLEAGFGFRLKFIMVIACPKGEQLVKQYWELLVCDSNLEQQAQPRRILARYPNAGSRSLSALFLGLLYEVENMWAEGHLWAEPMIGRRPSVG